MMRDASPSIDNPVEIISQTPALVAEAVESSGAQSGVITVTNLTSGGITINPLFDAAAMAAPASFGAGIQQAASLLTAAIRPNPGKCQYLQQRHRRWRCSGPRQRPIPRLFKCQNGTDPSGPVSNALPAG